LDSIEVEVWLYGQLARYGGEGAQGSYAKVHARLPRGATLGDLMASLGIPADERGITFIDGQLSAMPGLQPDLVRALSDGNRIGVLDLRSMWPFQYRHGAAMVPEMRQAMGAQSHGGLHHEYRGGPSDEAATVEGEAPTEA
jgi:hypothetical protein